MKKQLLSLAMLLGSASCNQPTGSGGAGGYPWLSKAEVDRLNRQIAWPRDAGPIRIRHAANFDLSHIAAAPKPDDMAHDRYLIARHDAESNLLLPLGFAVIVDASHDFSPFPADKRDMAKPSSGPILFIASTSGTTSWEVYQVHGNRSAWVTFPLPLKIEEGATNVPISAGVGSSLFARGDKGGGIAAIAYLPPIQLDPRFERFLTLRADVLKDSSKGPHASGRARPSAMSLRMQEGESLRFTFGVPSRTIRLVASPARLGLTEPPRLQGEDGIDTPDPLLRPIDQEPEEHTPFLLRDPDRSRWQHIDFGCTGVLNDGFHSTLSTTGSEGNGWHGAGDVRITALAHTELFGSPDSHALVAAAGYRDATLGHCLLTTGNGRFRSEESQYDQLQPLFARGAQLWQKVAVPEQAASLQIRFAMLTQEFPFALGPYTVSDHIAISWDEGESPILSATLSQLAGSEGASAAAPCSNASETEIPVRCGDWYSAKGLAKRHRIASIAHSTEAAAMNSWGCHEGPCFTGWLPPRVFCHELTWERGEDLTLRFSVQDGFDDRLDTALAIDSIIFSKEGCGPNQPRMTSDPLLLHD